MTQTAKTACLIVVVSALVIGIQANLAAPPRYDGAGYAVLARSLEEGSGYRSIDHPDQPRHAHFPPGYPTLLALVWRFTGPSWLAAHLASCLCAVGASLAAWLWFRRIYSRDTALLLALALCVNWVWTRTGSSIQSEPLYMLLGQLAILVTARTVHRGGRGRGMVLGILLAACLLTRHVAIGLVAAMLIDLGLNRRWASKATAAFTTLALTIPWIAWIAIVGAGERTQARLLLAGTPGLAIRFATQMLFYLRRIPDQITGPFVEIATVIRPAVGFAALASAWSVAATGVVVVGWVVAVRRPPRRLAGLIPLLTLCLLLAWPYTEAGRFLIPLIPCLLVGAVEGLAMVLQRALRMIGASSSRRRLRCRAAILVLALSLPYSGYSLLSFRARATASEAGTRGFEAACAWLSQHGDRAGPVLTRHPGEVFLATGRRAMEVSSSERPGEPDASPAAINQVIERYEIAYLLIDDDRYLNAPATPLGRYAIERPDRVRRVWGDSISGSATTLYETVPSGSPARP